MKEGLSNSIKHNIFHLGAQYKRQIDTFYDPPFRERSHEFIVEADLGAPDKVNLQETGPYWKKFLEALRHYEDPKKYAFSRCLTQHEINVYKVGFIYL
jgi:hypothetical protein